MKVFLLDVAHDLRAKRLWPVAAALVVAILVVPVVLLGGGSSAPAPDATSTVPPPTGAAPAVEVVEGPASGRTSKLEEFRSHNPFKPDKRPSDEPEQAGSAPPAGGSGGAAPSQAAPSSADAPATTNGGDGSTAPKPSEPAKTPKSQKPGEPKPVKPAPVAPEVQVVSYQANLAYGRAGKVQVHRGLSALSVIPKQRRLIQFAGVARDGEQAVFTILDPRLVADKGDGHCTRVADRCTILRLAAGEERRFTDSGGEAFRLRVVGLSPLRQALDDLPASIRETLDKLG